eukprot:Sspe_Gene.10862::Locus_3662_Transcript_1_1_Confidence_1.000_Length_766::g.10862::m.10862/K08493/VTI1; vesicle transport through interaction with t-SNAREs 1
MAVLQCFESYQEIVKEAESELLTLPDCTKEEKKELGSTIRSELQRAYAQIRRCESEITALPNEERPTWRTRVQQEKRRLRGMEKELTQALKSEKRESLLGSMKEHLDSGDEGDRARRTARMLHSQGKSIERSERIGEQTEEVGLEIIGNLRGQRETLLHAIDMTDQTRVETTRSRAMVTRLRKNLAYNRLTQILIIVVLLVAISLVVYFRWVKK